MSTSPSSSADIIEGNDDFLIETLLFLPEKTLIRFKSVSKRWRSLISDPSFCRSHTVNRPRRRPETQPSFILGGYGIEHLLYDRKFLTFPLPPGLSKTTKILQSCNGLLLLSCGEAEEGRGRNSYHIFNPTTSQQRELTPLPNASNTFFGSIYLMFDPSLSPYYKVVYFAHTYKVVSVVNTQKSTHAYFYDSETYKWELGCKDLKYRGRGIYFNGCIYFVGSLLRSRSFRFNPVVGNVGMVPNPPADLPRGVYYHLYRRRLAMESNGVLLSLTSTRDEMNSTVLGVSEMKGNEDGWSDEYQIYVGSVLKRCGWNMYYNRLLGVIRGETEQDLVLVFRYAEKIGIYRVCDDDIQIWDPRSCVGDAEWVFSRYLQYHSFIRSLVPV